MAVGTGLAKAAMDLEATGAKYETVFEGMTDQADEFIKEFKKLTPATTAEARSMASGIQDLLVPMGFMRDEATNLTGEMMHAIGALTNFNSGTHDAERVTQAMQSALLGQYESLASLGIQLDVTTVKQKAVEQGMAKNTDEVTKQMMAQIMIQEVYAQSGDALTAYTEENLDATTKLGLLKTEIIDVAAKFGENLLPIITTAIDFLRELNERFGNLSEGQQKAILIIGAVVAAIGPLLLVVGKVMTWVPLIIAGFAKVKVVLVALTGPIGWVVLAIVGLIAILVTLYKKNEDFRNKVIEIWNKIKTFFEITMEVIKRVISTTVAIIQKLWEEHGEQIMRIVKMVWDFVYGIISSAMSFIAQIIDGVLRIIVGIWQDHGTLIMTVIKHAWNFISGYIKASLTYIENMIGLFINILTLNWKKAWTNIVNIAKAAWDAVKRVIKGGSDAWKEIGAELSNSFAKGIKSFEGDWSELAKSFTMDFGKGVEKGGAPVVKKVETLMKNIGTVAEKGGVATAEKVAKEIGNSADDVIKRAEEMVREITGQLDKMGEATVQALRKKYQEEERLQEESLRKQTQRIKDETDTRLKIYDLELKKKLDIINAEENAELQALQDKIDAINELTSLEDKATKDSEYASSLTNKQQELANIGMKDAIKQQELLVKLEEKQQALARVGTAKGRSTLEKEIAGITNNINAIGTKQAEARAKIQDEINDMVAKKEREQLLDSRSEQIKAIRAEMEAVRKQAEEERKEEENEIKVKQAHLKAQHEMNMRYYDDQLEANKTHYANLSTEEKLQARARELMLDGNNAELISILETYNPKWQDAGQSFGNSLINGLNSTKTKIASIVSEIGNMIGMAQNPIVNEFTPAIDMPGLANGGNINRAGSVLVGERGPEILNLPRGASVTPLDTATTVNHTGTIRVEGVNNQGELMQSIEIIIEDIVDSMRREARLV